MISDTHSISLTGWWWLAKSAASRQQRALSACLPPSSSISRPAPHEARAMCRSSRAAAVPALTCQCSTDGAASVELGGVPAPFINLPVTGAHLARPPSHSTRACKPRSLAIYEYWQHANPAKSYYYIRCIQWSAVHCTVIQKSDLCVSFTLALSYPVRHVAGGTSLNIFPLTNFILPVPPPFTPSTLFLAMTFSIHISLITLSYPRLFLSHISDTQNTLSVMQKIQFY